MSSIQLEPCVVEANAIGPFIVPSGDKPNTANQFIIVISKDMQKSELSLLKEYGRVIVYEHNVYHNVAINTLQFDYFIINLRSNYDRHYFQQIDKSLIENMNIVSYCYSIEKCDDYHNELGADNIITKLPPKQAFKAEFDRLLLQKKISKPNMLFSCIKSIFRVVKGDWK